MGTAPPPPMDFLKSSELTSAKASDQAVLLACCASVFLAHAQLVSGKHTEDWHLN